MTVAGLIRLMLFAALWSVLAGGDWSHPAVPVITILAATVVSLFLWRPDPHRIRWSRLPPLILYFLWNSLEGGVDVARRVFSPAMPVRPDVIEYDCTIESETGRVVFAWMIGLMPGTASVDWDDGGRIAVHVIDRRMYDAHTLRQLEKKLLAVLQRRAR